MEKKTMSLKNVIIGVAIGTAVLYGLVHIETKDEWTVRLICAGAAFLFATFFLFLSWKLEMTEDIFKVALRASKRFKLPVWDPFRMLDAEGRLKPKSRLFVRIYYLAASLAAAGMGIAFFLIFR